MKMKRVCILVDRLRTRHVLRIAELSFIIPINVILTLVTKFTPVVFVFRLVVNVRIILLTTHTIDSIHIPNISY